LKPHKACLALITSNASIAKANTWQTTTNAPSEEIDLIGTGTQKKAQEAWKTKANSICLAVGGKKL